MLFWLIKDGLLSNPGEYLKGRGKSSLSSHHLYPEQGN